VNFCFESEQYFKQYSQKIGFSSSHYEVIEHDIIDICIFSSKSKLSF